MNMQQFRPPARQLGLVMISALLLLLVATILAAAMFRSFGTQEKIAGNLREKERAMHAAVTAQQYAEWFLQSGQAPVAGVCNSLIDSTAAVVCSNALAANVIANPALWPGQVRYLPPNPASSTSQQFMEVAPTTPGVGTYSSKPIFYIADLGPSNPPLPSGEIFQIDAAASGGTADTVAVVESTYLIVAGSGGGGRPADSAGGL
jgi:type IV pilus assembly protein PilX